MTYLDSGFDIFMSRVRVSAPTEMADYDSSYVLSQIDGSSVVSMSVDKLTTGVLNAVANIGSGIAGSYVRLDGNKNRIVIHDGTTNRIVIGNVS